MSKEVPYFKFYPSEWLVGKIAFQPLEVQGAFIVAVCMCWQKNGIMHKKDIDFRIGKKNLETLIELDFIQENNKNELSIRFIEEQMSHFGEIRDKRSEAGKKGAQAKAKKSQAIAKETKANDKQLLEKPKQTLANAIYKNNILNNNSIKETYKEFEKMRKSIRKPMTELAEKRLLEKLEKLSEGNADLKIKLLEQSIVNCWQDIFPLRQDSIQKPVNMPKGATDGRNMENLFSF